MSTLGLQQTWFNGDAGSLPLNGDAFWSVSVVLPRLEAGWDLRPITIRSNADETMLWLLSNMTMSVAVKVSQWDWLIIQG